MFQVYFELIFYWIGINCNGNGGVCIGCQFGIRIVVVFIYIIVGDFLSVGVDLGIVVIVVYVSWVVIFIIISVVIWWFQVKFKGFFVELILNFGC